MRNPARVEEFRAAGGIAEYSACVPLKPPEKGGDWRTRRRQDDVSPLPIGAPMR